MAKMRPLRFFLIEEVLHREVGSCLRVACEITEGRHKYLFGALTPQGQGEDGAESSKKRPADDEIDPIVV